VGVPLPPATEDEGQYTNGFAVARYSVDSSHADIALHAAGAVANVLQHADLAQWWTFRAEQLPYIRLSRLAAAERERFLALPAQLLGREAAKEAPSAEPDAEPRCTRGASSGGSLVSDEESSPVTPGAAPAAPPAAAMATAAAEVPTVTASALSAALA